MALTLVALSLLSPVQPLPEPVRPITGTWSQYGLAPSEGQIWFHSTVTGKLQPGGRYDGFIAVLDCELVGREAWIQVWPLKRWQHVKILDCSGHASTTRWFNEAGIIGELFYRLARKNGVPIGRGVKGSITMQQPQDGRLTGWREVQDVDRDTGDSVGVARREPCGDGAVLPAVCRWDKGD